MSALATRITAVLAELEALERETDSHIIDVLGDRDVLPSQVVAATRVHDALRSARWQLVGLTNWVITSEVTS